MNLTFFSYELIYCVCRKNYYKLKVYKTNLPDLDQWKNSFITREYPDEENFYLEHVYESFSLITERNPYFLVYVLVTNNFLFYTINVDKVFQVMQALNYGVDAFRNKFYQAYVSWHWYVANNTPPPPFHFSGCWVSKFHCLHEGGNGGWSAW